MGDVETLMEEERTEDDIPTSTHTRRTSCVDLGNLYHQSASRQMHRQTDRQIDR